MRLFIALSFVLLAVAYWLASGGPGFVPEARPVAEAEPAAVVTVTRAEAPESDLVAPPPEAGALSLEPEAGPEPVAEVATPTGPEGLPETPVAPDEALAALAPDLAAGEAPEELVEAAAPGGAGREVTGDGVNLREGPGTSFDVVGRLDRGDRAEVIELRDGWAWVRVGGAEGWMSERFLAP